MSFLWKTKSQATASFQTAAHVVSHVPLPRNYPQSLTVPVIDRGESNATPSAQTAQPIILYCLKAMYDCNIPTHDL